MVCLVSIPLHQKSAARETGKLCAPEFVVSVVFSLTDNVTRTMLLVFDDDDDDDDDDFGNTSSILTKRRC